MLAEMTPGQFLEWKEFARVEPFGFGATADFFAVLCAVVANSAPFRSGPGVSPEAFRLRPDREPGDGRPADGETMLAGAETVGPDLSRPITDD